MSEVVAGTSARARAYERARPYALALVVLGMLVSLAALAVPKPEQDLARDLAAGKVRAVAVGQHDEFNSTLRLTLRLGGSASEDSVDTVRWTTSSGALYEARLSELRSLVEPVSADAFPTPDESLDQDAQPAGVRRAVLESIARTAVAAGASAPRRLEPRGTGREQLLAIPLLVWLGAVVLLVIGPQPRRLTKWGTFAVITAPGGVGLLWHVLRDAPWSVAANVDPEPAPHWTGPGRRGLWTGVGWFVLIAVVLGVLSSALLRALPDGTGSYAWQIVTTNGQTISAGG